MINNIIKQKGSALIISLLIMGILITLAVGLSELVVREVRVTSDVLKSGKAFYAAEAGIESALLDLHRLPKGFDFNSGMNGGKLVIDGNKYYMGLSETVDLDFKYDGISRAKVIPKLDTSIVDAETAMVEPKKYLYNTLDLNQSITIPLFYYDEGSGEEKNVTSFRVEFFTEAEINPQFQNIQINNIPILRWKIVGKKTIDGEEHTETMGDYIGMNVGSEAFSPTCLGTDSNIYESEEGVIYEGTCAGGSAIKVAREAYLLESMLGVLSTVSYYEDLTGETIEEIESNLLRISDFIAPEGELHGHKKNYLTLTNIFNSEVIAQSSGSYVDRNKKARIYYRIILPKEGEYTNAEYAQISAVGEVGGPGLNKQKHTIKALIHPDRFMPVFNFSLYRTDTSREEAPEIE